MAVKLMSVCLCVCVLLQVFATVSGEDRCRVAPVDHALDQDVIERASQHVTEGLAPTAVAERVSDEDEDADTNSGPVRRQYKV